MYSLCIACNAILSSTQAEVASRDAMIRQLEERCELLTAQVSTALDNIYYLAMCPLYVCILCIVDIQWALICVIHVI